MSNHISGPERPRPGTRLSALSALAGLGIATAFVFLAQPRPVDPTPVGGAADPPFPAGAPAVALEPEVGLANHDGSVVVELRGGAVRFRGPVEAEPVAVDGEWDLRAVSTDGALAALFHFDGKRSEIAVVDPSAPDGKGVRTMAFPGLVEPEAFSTDGGELFVIDHRAAREPGAYRVRPLDLETGRLETILGPSKIPLIEEMNGVGRRQVWSADGARLYTLYIRQTHHHHKPGDGAAADEQVAHAHGQPGTDGFVHVLDLTEEWAFCLDLPPDFGQGDLDSTALAVSPDGTELAVLDLNAGRLALASTSSLTVTGTAPVPDTVDPEGEVHLGLFPDHLAVGWGDSLSWLARPSLSPLGTATLRAPLIGLSSFDRTLLAWTEDLSQGPQQLAPPTED